MKGTARRAAILGATVAMWAAVYACNEGGPAARDGTARMADTLAALYARAVAEPNRNAFLNRERAAALGEGIAAQGGRGPVALQLRYFRAQELLAAGETRQAIAEVRALMQAAGVAIDKPTRQHKPLFDLLAIAHLRLGEQENCVLNPAASTCTLGSVRHERQEGARDAIAVYEQLLRTFPNDYGSRWLLNVAHMAAAGYPASVPRRFLIPNLTLERDTAFPRFVNIAADVGVDVNGLSGGLCVEDFNRDGLLDLFTTSWGLADPVHLFLADGQGGYVDATARTGLNGIVGGLNCTHADYDNDGDSDILILRGAWLGDAGRHPNSLLRNRGDATFEDVTFAAGLASFHPTHSAAFADFNLDGFLDLFVGNESGLGRGGSSHASELYVNNRDGTFTEVASRVGLAVDAFVKGVAWGDVNNDGLPDLFVSVLFGPNRLFVNRGGRSLTDWRFEDVTASAGVHLPIMSFPTWFWDFDNDGWEDLLVLSYDIRSSGALHDAVAMEYLGMRPVVPHADSTIEIEHSRLYRNNGDGTFKDVSRAVGLADKVIYAMGTNFGDIDNDGWLDFLVGTGNPDLRSIIPNRMFRNVRGQRFQEVTVEGGFGHLQKGHAPAFVDLDRDGDEDVPMVIGGAYQGDRFSSVLYENPGWPGRNWITLELEGRTANRSAIGARVELVVAESSGATRTLRRTVGTGGSFGAGSVQLHVGLAGAQEVREIRITWPDTQRSTSTHKSLSPNRVYRLVQGTEPVPVDRPPVAFRRQADRSHQHH